MFFDRKDNAQVIEIGQHLMQNRFPELAEVEAYWTALKGSRQVPARLDLDPRGIEGALSHVFALERIAPGVARVRLAGSHLNDLMGMDIRGMPLSAMIASQARKSFAECLEQVFASPARMVADLSAERALGKPRLEARLLILPMTDTQNRITRALGCLSTHGHTGRAPRRFVVQHHSLRPLDGTIPLPRTSPQPTSSTADPSQGCRHAQDTHPGPVSGKPFLRLIKMDE